jgi:stalled ribosome rescue protein Dom34
MKSQVVWVTSNEVNIITLAEPVQSKVMKMHGVRHHSEVQGKNHPKRGDDVDHFMHEVATELEKSPSRVLLVGPAEAKVRLKSHLDREHPAVAKNVVGVETLDKSTEGQIVDFAHRFFKKLGMYDAI